MAILVGNDPRPWLRRGKAKIDLFVGLLGLNMLYFHEDLLLSRTSYSLRDALRCGVSVQWVKHMGLLWLWIFFC